MSVNHSARSGGIIAISSRFFFDMNRGDSNEYKKYTIFNIKKTFTINYLKPAAMGLFLGTQARVRNSSGKRAISVRAIEVLL